MRRTALPALLLLLLAFGCDSFRAAELGTPSAGGGLPVKVFVSAGVLPADVSIVLDGADVRPLFSVAPGGLVATLPLPAPGLHELAVTQPNALGVPTLRRQFFDVPAPAPAPAIASFAPTGSSLPATSWLRLSFASDLDAAMLKGFAFSL